MPRNDVHHSDAKPRAIGTFGRYVAIGVPSRWIACGWP